MKKTAISVVRGFLRPRFYDRILKIITFFLLISTLSANRVSAQESAKATGLSVGQAIPDVLLDVRHPVLGREQGAFVLLSEHKGKPFILDFWATWCGSCLKSLPQVDSINRAYSRDVTIFMVNSSLRDKGRVETFVDSFLAKHRSFSVPFLAQNDLFSAYFKINLLPHYVWIGADGKIKAITGYKSLTYESVRRFLSAERGSVNLGGL